MKVLIKSREDIEEMTKHPFNYEVAIISITDYGWSFAQFGNQPHYLLQLKFDDVDAYVFEDELGRAPTEQERIAIEEKYHMCTDFQAKEIANFYNRVCNNVEVIVCQCEHGESRSAAVVSAIMEYRDKNGISIFADDKYCPNKLVFRKVLKELNK